MKIFYDTKVFRADHYVDASGYKATRQDLLIEAQDYGEKLFVFYIGGGPTPLRIGAKAYTINDAYDGVFEFVAVHFIDYLDAVNTDAIVQEVPESVYTLYRDHLRQIVYADPHELSELIQEARKLPGIQREDQ